MIKRKLYIRFGEIPKNGRSSVYKYNTFIKYEMGISVYDACKIHGKWHVVLPLNINKDTICTYEKFRIYCKTHVYLVSGEKIGIGNDGEPLIKNVKILKDLTIIYYEDKKA